MRDRTTGATRRRLNHAVIVATVALMPALASASALPAQSWNGYHWTRTGPLAIALGSNVSAAWAPFVAAAGSQWSAASAIDFVATAGTTAPAACGPVYGTVQVCSGNYGKNGWLGYATVYTYGSVIVEATVKLNDYYFTGGTYASAAWRAQTACQEIGHTLGLAHNDTDRNDANKGSCMDYTNDPTGTKATNGSLANLAPGITDFTALDQIYAHLDMVQLPMTRPGYRSGDALGVGDDVDSEPQALPEPATWALFVAGLGGVGGLQRRRRLAMA